MICVLSAAAMNACAADNAATSNARAPAITDSAGVRRVVNYDPKWQRGEEWTVDSAPALRIGAIDGAEEYLFDRIQGVTRLSDGTIVVLNAGDGQLQYYGPDGSHLHSVSRDGRGPGEMRAGRWLDGSTMMLCRLRTRMAACGSTAPAVS